MQNEKSQPHILILGAADTGRAPMAAAMLQRHLQRRHVDALIGSAGILGHDGDPATEEAQRSVEQMGLSIETHVARSLTEELADSARLMIAIDTGILRVARSRFHRVAERIYSLGELAGQERDIPDPFKMQMGAWLAYATEMDRLLECALPRIAMYLRSGVMPDLPETGHHVVSEALAAAPIDPAPAVEHAHGAALVSEPTPGPAASVSEAAERMLQLLNLIMGMPHVIAWDAARLQIATDLDRLLSDLAPSDLAAGLAGLIRAALSMTPTTPTSQQAKALHSAISVLRGPVHPSHLSDMSAQLARWGAK